ncbi:MAG: hypothetical protein KAF27_09675 [Porphyrobacter sp.]|nr:hypothetical protein [Porphyrobacter sp.]
MMRSRVVLMYRAPVTGSTWMSLPSILVEKSGVSVFMGSAMRTAPPCNNATPAAAADSFAMASLSDMVEYPVCYRRLARTGRTSSKSSLLLMSEAAQGQSG